MLALAVAVAPWPPQAFAAFGLAAPVEHKPVVEKAPPCHEAAAVEQAAPAAPDCPEGCCDAEGCNPAQCALAHLVVVVPAAPVLDERLIDRPEFVSRMEPPPIPPIAEQIRPPIA